MPRPGKQARYVGADGRQLFSVSQAGRFLGRKASQIRELRRAGRLRSIVIEGTHLYHRDELERFRAARADEPARLSARAFELFEAGRSPVDAVIELGADPSVVAELHRSWCDLSGTVVVGAPKGSLAAWERTYGVGKLTPSKVRLAIELVATHPELRAQLRASA